MGLEHGGYCVGCCWGLMLILFALGVMSIVWMALVAGLIFAEKVLPRGKPPHALLRGCVRRPRDLGRRRARQRPRAQISRFRAEHADDERCRKRRLTPRRYATRAIESLCEGRVPEEAGLGATKSHRHVSQDPPALAAIAALSDPVVGTLDGTIHSWNAGAERLFGYSADEIVGKTSASSSRLNASAEIEQILERLRRGETIKQFETVRRRKDGTDIHVSLSISPVRNSSGDIIGASAIEHDISERKRREEIQSFLAEASRLLAANLDHRETLPTRRPPDAVASPTGAWSRLSDAAGSLTQVAIAHRDPDKAELMREMRRLYPPDAGPPGHSRVASSRTGKAELIPEVSDALLKNIAQNADHLRMLRELGAGSLIVVPLRARERVDRDDHARQRQSRAGGSRRTISTWPRISRGGRRWRSTMRRCTGRSRRPDGEPSGQPSGSAGSRPSPQPCRERCRRRRSRTCWSSKAPRQSAQTAASFGS